MAQLPAPAALAPGRRRGLPPATPSQAPPPRQMAFAERTPHPDTAHDATGRIRRTARRGKLLRESGPGIAAGPVPGGEEVNSRRRLTGRPSALNEVAEVLQLDGE